MAEIKECIGKKVKISKNSTTIKSDDGKNLWCCKKHCEPCGLASKQTV